MGENCSMKVSKEGLEWIVFEPDSNEVAWQDQHNDVRETSGSTHHAKRNIAEGIFVRAYQILLYFLFNYNEKLLRFTWLAFLAKIFAD